MLEPISQNDIPALVALMNRAYRGTGSASGWNSEADYISGDRTSEQLVRADVAEKPHATLLKWTPMPGGEISGCVWLEPLDETTWYLGSLATDPIKQNDGLGKSVLAAAEQWARDRGAALIRMTVVNVRDTLIAWYLRRGYHLTGEAEPFPYGDNRFGIPLRQDLHFVVMEKRLKT